MANKHEDRTIAYQIITFIFLFLFIIFSVYVGITRFLFSRVMTDNARDSVSHLAHETIYEIDGKFGRVEALGKTILELNNMKALTEEEFNHYLFSIVYEYPEVECITLAYDPALHNGLNAKSVFYESNRELVLPYPNTDYQYMDWFQIPLTLEKKFWTEPWFDQFATRQVVVSFCLPIFSGGRCTGIIRLDTKLSDLQNMVTPLKLKRSGFAFLISEIGTIITHPADSLVMDESIFSLAEQYNDPQLRKIGRAMINGDVQFVRTHSKSFFGDSWVFFSPLYSNNWSLGIVIANADVMRDLNLLLIIQLLISIVSFLTISIIVYYRTLSVSKPLRVFTDVAQKIGKGNFDTELPEIGTSYEIDRLTQSFAAMQNSLKEYIHNLQITSAEKNRIIAEVRIASEIQRNLIPKNEKHPNISETLRIYGILEPASEIGGDLFEYFPIDERYFCFGIADVAGKGIAAAMTMTMVSTFLRTVAKYHQSSGEILEQLNNFLARNNIEANFVTILLGIIDLQEDVLEFSNAGHVPMIIRKINRSYLKYSETHSTAVGMFENLKIASQTIKLDIGDELILFTDGITEAMNSQEEFLTVAGLEKIIQNLGMPNPELTATSILERVSDFRKGSAEKDDITILVLDYKHPKRRD